MFDRLLLAGFAILLGLGLAPSATAQTSASNFTSGTRYDLARRVVGTIAPDPDGSGMLHYAAVRNSYDIDGRLTKVEKGELADWQSEAVAPSDWPLHTTFNIFQIVDITYDLLDRKTVERVSGYDASHVLIPETLTQYSYDAVGRLECTAVRMNPAAFGSLPASACTLGTAGSNGPDRITKTVYDDVGQVLKVQKAYGVTTANGFPTTLQQDYQAYAYNPNGTQASVTDANQNKSVYGYDGLDRLTTWYFPNQTTANTASTTDYEQYGYDPNGNRTSLRKRDGRTISYTYDALNRVTIKAFGGGTCVGTYTCTAPPPGSVRDVYYSYDAWGRETAARFDSSSGADKAQNSYDGFGRLIASRMVMGGYTRTVGLATDTDGHLTYDADGNHIRITHPDGNYFTYEYDGLNRLVAIRENGSTQVASMAYNARGERTSSARGGVLTSYGYDPISRLASLADDLYGTTNDVTATFTYTPSSQILTQGRTNTLYAFPYSAVTKAYAVNGLNQYTAVSGSPLGYDSNGNLSANGLTSYIYDVENRLVRMTSSSTSTDLIYDPMGRLFQTSGASGTRQFLYDGDAMIAEYDNANVLLKRYVHGPDEDDPLLWYEGSSVSSTNRRSLQADHQGSIISVANASGGLIAINSYDEYGVPGNGNLGTFQYTGQAWLPDIGMYYYKARIYSSGLGRFLQTDPIGYKDQMDLYAYADNDPVDGRDPSGLDPHCLGTCPYYGDEVVIGISNKGIYINPTAPHSGDVASVAAMLIPGVGEEKAALEAAEASKGEGLFAKLGSTIASKFREFRFERRLQKVRDRLEGWIETPNKKGIGSRFQDPANRGNRVRVDRGNPNHSLPSQRVDHVVEQRNGIIVDAKGNPITGDKPSKTVEAHIPLVDWLRSWF